MRETVTSPLLSLEPLILGEASCYAMRLLKQTYDRSTWQGSEAFCQSQHQFGTLWVSLLGSRSNSPSQSFR